MVAIAQTLRDPQSGVPPGSIYGRVTDQSTNQPLAGVSVYTSYYFWRISAVTDGDGRFVLPGLGQGQYAVKATSGTVWATGVVALRSGRDRAAVNFRLPFGAISGTVLDYLRRPAPGISVFLIQGQYLLGELRYTLAGVTTTGRNGQYLLKGVVPSRRYALLAKETDSVLLATSRVPAAPESRRLIAAPTYYPSYPEIEAAPPVLVGPGEALDGVDIRMGQSRSYCIEGTLESAAGGLSFQLFEEYPTDGFSTLQGPQLALMPPRGRTGSDGRIRVCDLHPGTYRLTALQDTPDSVALFGSMPVVITDRDRRDVHLRAGQAQPLPGRVVWDGTPPTLSERRSITVRLEPLNRGVFPGERLEAQPGIPDSFVLGRVLLDDYAVMVSDVPANLYVKEISYAGRNVLQRAAAPVLRPQQYGASRRPRARRGFHPCPGTGPQRETRARAIPLHLPGQRRFRGRSGGVAGIRRNRPAGPVLLSCASSGKIPRAGFDYGTGRQRGLHRQVAPRAILGERGGSAPRRYRGDRFTADGNRAEVP